MTTTSGAVCLNRISMVETKAFEDLAAMIDEGLDDDIYRYGHE